MRPSLFLFLLLLITSCDRIENVNEYQDITAVGSPQGGAYLGDQSCKACHQEAFNDWQGSHHDKAMQLPDEQSVLGDFNEKEVILDDVTYFFYKKDKEFHVRIRDIDAADKDYKIVYVFGYTPLQQYIVAFPDGKKQVLRISWDCLEKKWFHQYAGDKIEVTDWLHWQRGAQNWNTMCAECHSTELKKNYFVEKDSFHTTYSSINVSCESCHGPGEKHVTWANGDQRNKNMQVILGADQKSQLNMCAPCHARRVKLTENMVPGLNFDDQYLVQNISADFYHPDGQILEEDYVYGSFLQSKMYANGIRCADCHDVHSMRLKATGNKLCLQCHIPANYDTPKHHFHEMNTEGAQCINCHMTGRYYMGNDFRRDHSFRIPRPDQSVSFGTPNACNECHDEKSEEWAAQWVVDWYGKERRPHFSDYLLLSQQTDLDPEDRKKLNDFINDLTYPAISRSTVINNLSYTDEDEIMALLTALKDSSAVVRYNALMQFRGMSPQERISVAQGHVNDSSRLVRIGSAQLIIGFDGEGWTESDKLDYFGAKEELEHMLFSNADFSTGRLQLGDYFMQTNDVRAAINHYEKALEMDSLLFPVYTNLATAYSINQQTDKALETLNIWMDLEPDAARPYFLRALLNFELGNNEIAVEDLKMAIELDPRDIRSMYNLATYYYQIKEFQLADEQVKKALRLEPANRDVRYLQALLLRAFGRIKEADFIMKDLEGA